MFQRSAILLIIAVMLFVYVFAFFVVTLLEDKEHAIFTAVCDSFTSSTYWYHTSKLLCFDGTSEDEPRFFCFIYPRDF